MFRGLEKFRHFINYFQIKFIHSPNDDERIHTVYIHACTKSLIKTIITLKISDNFNIFKIMVIALWDDGKTGHIYNM